MKKTKQKTMLSPFTVYEYKFTAMRLEDMALMPAEWTMSVDLVILKTDKEEMEEVEIDVQQVFQKLQFWTDVNLADCIFVNASNEQELKLAYLFDNNIVTVPGDVLESLIVQILHAKMTSLAGERLYVGEMRLGASDSRIKYTFGKVKEYELPLKVSDYFEDAQNPDDKAWWYRDDGFSYEFLKGYVDEASDPMEEFHKTMKLINNQDTMADIVKVEKWQPKTV